MGQIAIIAAVFPVLFMIRQLSLYRWVLRVGSTALVAIGLLWAAERTLGFNVPLAQIARGAVGLVTGSPSGA
jgi:hypothetical protein